MLTFFLCDIFPERLKPWFPLAIIMCVGPLFQIFMSLKESC